MSFSFVSRGELQSRCGLCESPIVGSVVCVVCSTRAGASCPVKKFLSDGGVQLKKSCEMASVDLAMWRATLGGRRSEGDAPKATLRRRRSEGDAKATLGGRHSCLAVFIHDSSYIYIYYINSPIILNRVGPHPPVYMENCCLSRQLLQAFSVAVAPVERR
jgi:hypothetical protein